MHITRITYLKKRAVYAALALLLFFSGILLVIYGGEFPHLRGWFGDYLIAIFLFFSLKTVLPLSNAVRLAAGVFAFSTAVEFIQLAGLARKYDLTSAFWQLTIGSRFDAHDIAMYAAGCATAVVIDVILVHKR